MMRFVISLVLSFVLAASFLLRLVPFGRSGNQNQNVSKLHRAEQRVSRGSWPAPPLSKNPKEEKTEI